MSNYHVMHPSNASDTVGNAVRTLALKYGTKREPYIAIKSNNKTWHIDQKTNPTDGYHTPSEWLRLWYGIGVGVS